MFNFFKKQKGALLIYLIVIIALFSILMIPVLDIVSTRLGILRTAVEREQALQIAEAGVNYYQWHLTHFPNDYQDGTGQAGPYVHDYIDGDTQEVLGEFSLVITPPPVGSTVVTIQSTGRSDSSPQVTRTVTVQYGIPSLAKYAFLSNEAIWIGEDEAVTGTFMSNNGIRFDGSANAPIRSAKPDLPVGYICPAGQGDGCPTIKPGIWGSPTQEVKNLWQFPVQFEDYSSLTSTLSDMQDLANDAGGEFYFGPSGAQGYSFVFNSDGTVTVYKVNSLLSNPAGKDWVNNVWTSHPEYTDYNTRTILSGYDHKPFPANGIIYVEEDDVWVEGIVRGRVTVAAAKLGETNLANMPSIFIPHSIVYSAKDGSDSLALIAQKSVLVTYRSDNDLEINAAMVAQNGSVERYYWGSNIKNSIIVYGSIMTYGMWTWTWVCPAVCSGYRYTYSYYDPYLLYSPPPSFPLSNSGYQQLNWKSD